MQVKFFGLLRLLNFWEVNLFFDPKLKSCHFLRTCTMFEQRSAQLTVTLFFYEDITALPETS